MKKITTLPFRVGKKQKRVVLDSKGLEVAHFIHGEEKLAQDYVNWINNFKKQNEQRKPSNDE